MKNPHAQALGRLGGLARAAKMSDEQKAASTNRARQAKAIRARIQRGLQAKPGMTHTD